MKDDIKKAVEILKKGGTILYPTETVWGIGCDATNSAAVEKLYSLKQKNKNEAALVLVSDIDMIYKCVYEVPEMALQLIEVTDKPLTLILPNASGLAPEILGEDGSIGVRLTVHDYCRNLVRALKAPLVSTSANVSGQVPPKSFGAIAPEIVNGVDFIVDEQFAGKMTGIPSSIIKIGLSGEVKIIRK